MNEDEDFLTIALLVVYVATIAGTKLKKGRVLQEDGAGEMVALLRNRQKPMVPYLAVMDQPQKMDESTDDSRAHHIPGARVVVN